MHYVPTAKSTEQLIEEIKIALNLFFVHPNDSTTLSIANKSLLVIIEVSN